jgi:hypothetical protein
VLAPAGRTGRDGQAHRPVSQDVSPPADGDSDRAPASTVGL